MVVYGGDGGGNIPIIELIVIPGFKVLRILIRNLLIRQPITNTRIQLIQRLPLQTMILLGQMLRSCDGATERRSPYSQRSVVADGVPDHLWELACVGLSVFREHGVAADLACEVEFGFAVLWWSLADAP